MLNSSELPQPSAPALAVSRELAERIRQKISAAGSIGFDDFMHTALYEPGLGYYMGGAVRFGADGDFITAPELSPMFGSCIATQCQDVLRTSGGGILEFGAGSGLLAASVLKALEESQTLPEQYSILELSPSLRERQQQTIATHVAGALERVRWISELPKVPFNGVVLANEILDAFPVKVLRATKGEIFERQVTVREGEFDWLDVPAEPGLAARFRSCVPAEIIAGESDYVSEINIGIESWIADLARITRRAVALIIDYGFPRNEYFHPHRTAGTLMCHFRHRTHNDPFYLPGLQDLTASIDFTAVAEAAIASELSVLGFAEQSSFLLSNGLLDVAERRAANAREAQQQRIAHETKVLTLPTEMGARFKVMALGKDYNLPLRGFHLRDDRHRL